MLYVKHMHIIISSETPRYLMYYTGILNKAYKDFRFFITKKIEKAKKAYIAIKGITGNTCHIQNLAL